MRVSGLRALHLYPPWWIKSRPLTPRGFDYCAWKIDPLFCLSALTPSFSSPFCCLTLEFRLPFFVAAILPPFFVAVTSLFALVHPHEVASPLVAYVPRFFVHRTSDSPGPMPGDLTRCDRGIAFLRCCLNALRRMRLFVSECAGFPFLSPH